MTREGVRAVTVGRGHEECRDQRRRRGGQDHRDQAETTGRGDQVGSRLPHGERAHHRPDGEAPLGAEPGGGHLHRGRIDPGQEASGPEPGGEGDGEAASAEQGGIDPRRERGAPGEIPAAGDDVGQVEDGRGQGPGHEPQLDRGGEPGGLAAR